MKPKIDLCLHILPFICWTMVLASPWTAWADSQALQQAIQSAQILDFDKAQRILDEAIKNDKRNPVLWFNLGNVHFLKEENIQAIVAYRKVIRLQSPLAPAASLYIAKSYRQLKKWQKAHKTLKNLQKRPLPQNLKQAVAQESENLNSDLLEQAVIFYKQGRYSRALASVKEANSVVSTSDGQALMALIYARQNKVDRAESILSRQQSHAIYTHQEELKEMIFRLKERGKHSDKITNLLEASFGHNSNLYGDPRSLSPTAAQILTLQNSVYHRLIQDEDFGLEAKYDQLFEDIYSSPGWTSLDEQTLGLGGEVRYYHFLDEWEVSLSPSLRHIWLSSSPLFVQPGLQFYGQRLWSNSRLGIGLQFSAQHHLDSDYSFLSQRQRTLSIDWRHTYSQSTTNPFFEYTDVDSSDLSLGSDSLPLAYTGLTLGYRYIHYLSDLWILDGTASVEQRYYKNKTLAERLSRNDSILKAHAKVWRQLQRHFSTFLSLTWTNVDSTLDQAEPDNKNYDQWTLHGGLIWRTSM